jgi:hypothetical protein
MLGADFAKAAPASLTVAFVSKTAIASAAAGGYTLIKLSTLLHIMKNKVIIIASACLLVAGGSAVYVSTRPSASAAAKDSASGSISSASTNPVTAISQEIGANSFRSVSIKSSMRNSESHESGSPKVPRIVGLRLWWA